MARIGLRRLRLIDGARAATGHAVVIDVLRAATTCAYVLAAGADRVVFVEEPGAALALRAGPLPAAVLVGEVDGVKIPEFDLDNSASLAEGADVRGRVVVQRTGAGARGLVAATRADALYFAAFVNAGATAVALRRADARLVSLVAIGHGSTAPAEEDEACAAYIESLLLGRPLPGAALLADLRRRLSLDHPAPTWREDVERAFAIDRFDFAIRVAREDALVVGRRA